MANKPNMNVPAVFDLSLGDGIMAHMDHEEKVLYVRIDVSKPGKPSASQKSTIIASTRGSVPVHNYRLGLNLFEPVKSK